MGKSEKKIFFGNYCSLRSQSCLKKSPNEFMKLSEYKGQGHSLTLVKGHSDFKVKTCFTQKQLGDLEPKPIRKLKEERKFIQMSWVT